MLHLLKVQNDRRAKKQGNGKGQNEWGEPTSAFHLTNKPRLNITGKEHLFLTTINNYTHTKRSLLVYHIPKKY